MTERRSYAIKPSSKIWGISSAVLSSNLCCLIKTTILKSEHVIFLALPSKYLFILKKEIGQKLLSYNYESTGWLIV